MLVFSILLAALLIWFVVSTVQELRTVTKEGWVKFFLILVAVGLYLMTLYHIVVAFDSPQKQEAAGAFIVGFHLLVGYSYGGAVLVVKGYRKLKEKRHAN